MDLHIILIVFIVLIVAVLLIHGLWSSRREKSQLFKSAKTFTYDSRVQNNDILDIDSAPADHQQPAPSTETPAQSAVSEAPMSVAQEVEKIRITLPDQPQTASQTATEPKASLSRSSLLYKSVAEIEQQADSEYGITITAPEDRAALAERAAKLPKIDDLQTQEAPITLQEPTKPKAPESAPKPQSAPNNAEKKTAPSDTIIFYVVPKASAFKGLEIVQSLESLGFSFGEGQLFHRHFQLQDTTSPILFSAANMYKPGIFDMANIADFTSQGLIVFMTLPTHGNDLANFRLLLHSVKTLSDDLNGEVLDVHRTPFNEQSKAAYLAMLQ
ncbi:cell division protein ZipA [Pasteurellaceae bacterium HPA106]|uniref:cell division protein ZipA n=1 Tax=Spirabiliibacterium pneumoniae TaxID=221400 RepID=UPI001AADE4DB|nr:cell division protein ZipA [Spirabiliibacterium pneumoniae]MBE2895791.1 cell division protein ZipA [Spirabiliibacterium pneumoniae]